MATTLRTFIAIAVPESVRRHCRQLQAQLELPPRAIRWVPEANIHLTLRFLGSIEASQIAGLTRQIDAVAADHGPFELQAAAPGCFPNPRRARVVWVGLAGQIRRLHQLQAGLEEGLAAIGFTGEKRRFHPHLTLGRCRQRHKALALEEQLASLKTEAGPPFTVAGIDLMQSELAPGGARYRRLHRSQLAGQARRQTR